MKNLVVIVLLLSLIGSVLPGSIKADGAIFITEEIWRLHRERGMINEPDQKAVVFFSKGKEDLIISPSYEGPVGDFAWVIPVPSRPKVEILKGAIFHELAELTVPRPKTRSYSKSATRQSSGVSIIERKTVGAYDVSVLSATDGKALMKWLKTNKYHLPEKAVSAVDYYVKQQWTFVACRIKAPENSKGLQTGTLAPIRLTFSAKQPVYPIRLSAANPKAFNLLVYLIAPSREVRKAKTVPKVTQPQSGQRSASQRAAVLPKGQKKYPTLARLSEEELCIYKEHIILRPDNCTQDYIWKLR